jgi:hypothetical protein
VKGDQKEERRLEESSERREMRGDITVTATAAESPSNSNSRCDGLSDCIHTSREL